MKRWLLTAMVSLLSLPLLTQARSPKDLLLLKATEQVQKSTLGSHAIIKLSECDAEIIRSANDIQQFLYGLCQLKSFKPYGDPHIVHCGTEHSGYSAVQFLDKGHVIVHVINNNNSITLAITCDRSFNANEIAKFSQDFFKATTVSIKNIQA